MLWLQVKSDPCVYKATKQDSMCLSAAAPNATGELSSVICPHSRAIAIILRKE